MNSNVNDQYFIYLFCTMYFFVETSNLNTFISLTYGLAASRGFNHYCSNKPTACSPFLWFPLMLSYVHCLSLKANINVALMNISLSVKASERWLTFINNLLTRRPSSSGPSLNRDVWEPWKAAYTPGGTGPAGLECFYILISCADPAGYNLWINTSTCQSHPTFQYATPQGEIEHFQPICPSPEPLLGYFFDALVFVIYKGRKQEAFSASDAFFLTSVVTLPLLAAWLLRPFVHLLVSVKCNDSFFLEHVNS